MNTNDAIEQVTNREQAETMIHALLKTFLEITGRFPDADIGINQCRRVRDAVNRIDWPDAYFHQVSCNGYSMQYASTYDKDFVWGDHLPKSLRNLPDERITRRVAPLYQGAWKTVGAPETENEG